MNFTIGDVDSNPYNFSFINLFQIIARRMIVLYIKQVVIYLRLKVERTQILLKVQRGFIKGAQLLFNKSNLFPSIEIWLARLKHVQYKNPTLSLSLSLNSLLECRIDRSRLSVRLVREILDRSRYVKLVFLQLSR